MAWTTADRDALKSAIATGALKVVYPNGTEITYRSLREMRQTLALIDADVAGAVTRVKTVRAYGRSGLR